MSSKKEDHSKYRNYLLPQYYDGPQSDNPNPGRVCITIDPRIPLYNAGTERVRFSPKRQTLLAPSAMEGRGGRAGLVEGGGEGGRST